MMLTGAYPYDDKDGRQDRIICRILSAQYELPPHVPLSDSCRDLIRQMFVVNPLRRISMGDIKLHPWYTTAMSEEPMVRLLLRPLWLLAWLTT